MFYGEVYGYAHYLQINDMIPQKVSFFWEDVVCRYWPWLKKKRSCECFKNEPSIVSNAWKGAQLVLSGTHFKSVLVHVHNSPKDTSFLMSKCYLF